MMGILLAARLRIHYIAIQDGLLFADHPLDDMEECGVESLVVEPKTSYPLRSQLISYLKRTYR